MLKIILETTFLIFQNWISTIFGWILVIWIRLDGSMRIGFREVSDDNEMQILEIGSITRLYNCFPF